MSSRALVLLVASAALVDGVAQAGEAVPVEQHYEYTLTAGGTPVGKRELTVTWIPAAADGSAPATRLLSSWTEVDAVVAGQKLHFANRATARIASGRTSLSSSVDENGTLREVQARQGSDGRWTISVLETGARRDGELRGSQVTLTSLDLVDPEQMTNFTRQSRVSLLTAETGTLLSGPVEDLGEGAVTIGGTSVAVHRYAWTPEPGRVELAWSQDGVLVSYQTTVLGKVLAAQLTSAPQPRTFGEIGPITENEPVVIEEEL